MDDTLLMILVIGVMLVVMWLVPRWGAKRAIPAVINIFRDNRAVTPRTAKTMDELGLAPKGLAQSMFKPRDYKQAALQSLIRANIVQMTEDGKLYLSEKDLDSSNLRDYGQK